MRGKLRILPLMDSYVWRISLGSWAVCLFFIVGLFILFDALGNLESFARSIQRLSGEGDSRGVLLVFSYYIMQLPFVYLMVAPFVTVTAGMFAVSRLMGANEIVPMIFTGRSLYRILMPVLLLGVLNMLAMLVLREFALPRLLQPRDSLALLLKKGQKDPVLENRILRIDSESTLIFETYRLRSARMEGVQLYVRRPEHRYQLRAQEALYKKDGRLGPGWYLTKGKRSIEGTSLWEPIKFHGFSGLDPARLQKELKQSRELMDLTFTDLAQMIREKPGIPDYVVTFHSNLTFPLANILLMILALPFALRFERGSKTEQVVFALLVCGAYFVVDLIFRNLGTQGTIHPVVAAWMPSILFGSLGIVLFDSVRT
ncbi:MAG TPA: YjgP/YjgQ family permease [Planctomycetes bacterium]|nr:YjgP/YjgQ family permease [Planctomycetota bacterium]